MLVNVVGIIYICERCLSVYIECYYNHIYFAGIWIDSFVDTAPIKLSAFDRSSANVITLVAFVWSFFLFVCSSTTYR